MKPKNTLILLILATGLFAFIRFYESKTPGTKEAADQAKRVFNLDLSAIDAISIISNENKIELHKKNSHWEMVTPVQDRADPMAVGRLLNSIGSMDVDSSFFADAKGFDKVSLNDLGLATSSVRLKLQGNDAPPELLFGKDTAVEGKMYVRFDGSKKVYAVSNDLKTQIQKKAEDFRDHKLLEFETRQVNKLNIKTPAGEIEMVKNGDVWSLDKPLAARGDARKISDLIAQVINAHIDTFENDTNLSAAGLSDPPGMISLVAGGTDETAVLQVGQPLEKNRNEVYAKLSTRPSVYTMSNKIADVLAIKPNDVRDKHLLELNLDTVDRIHIMPTGKPEITLARKQEDWTLKSQEDAAVNNPLVKKLVSDLQNQQIVAFVSDETSTLPKYGLDSPQLKVGFSAYASENTAESKAGDSAFLTVDFGKAEGDIVYARLESEPYVMSVPRTILDSIPADPALWRDQDIFKFKPDDIKSIEVLRDGLTTAIERRDTGWKIVKGSGAVNPTNIQSLLNILAGLQAVRWTGSSTAGLGFEKPSLVVSFTTSGGQSGKLTIGNANPQNMWNAEVAGVPGTFLVNKPDYDILRTDLTAAAPSSSPVESPSTTPAGVK